MLTDQMNDENPSTIDESQLAATIERLTAEGELTVDEAERLRQALPELMRQSAYILRHLAAHLTIGAIFAFDVFPIPLGSLSRGAWVIASRMYEEVRRDRERARVHSLVVLGIALVPFVGYFAYIQPLRAAHADSAFLYANHISYRRTGKSLRNAMARHPCWIQRLVHWTTAANRPPTASDEADS